MTDPRAAADRKPLRRAAFIALLAFLAGLVVTFLVSRALNGSVQAESHARFEGAVRRLEYEVARRINQSQYGLRGLAAAYASFGDLDTAQFREWVQARDLPVEFPGVRGFGFIRRVDREHVQAFLARKQKDDPAFALRSEGNAPDLYVVTQIEPRATNDVAYGFDLGQENVRRKGLERAVATGRMALTDRVSLFQDKNRRAGWLMVLPVFNPGEDPQSPAGRRRALRGLVYTPLIAADALADVRKTLGSELDFRLYDGPVKEGMLIFDSVDDPHEGVAVEARGGWEDRPLRTVRTLHIGGQDLVLDIAGRPELEAGTILPVVAALGGALLSTLLAFSIWQLANGRRKAEAIASSMTHDLQRAARELRSSEAFLEQAQRIAHIGGWEIDLDKLALRLSTQMLLLFDLPPDAQPDIEQFIGFFVPASQEQIGVATQLAVREGQPWDLELQMVSAKGAKRWVRTVGHVERQGDRSVRLIGTLQDITRFKEAEEALQSASAAKGQFLANTSHELRTPMNAVIGMLALLSQTDLSARQADYVTKAEGAARSLLALLNDILDFSKVEAGKLALDPRPFKVESLLRDLSVIIAANVHSENVEVLFDIDAKLPYVLVGDDMRLRQVLINLGGNAVKFTDVGEVVICAKLLAQTATHARIEFSVRDTGIGIAAEHQARIFEGFSQAEASTMRKYGGTGLGLAISQRLVSIMGGTLQLESKPGRGSRFFFELDLALGSLSPQDAVDTAHAAHVLFVDDNAVALDVFRKQAESLGWTADVAADAQQAFDMLRSSRRPYDAIFVDWRMPHTDGLQTAAQMRRMPELARSSLVIMVSAQARGRFAELNAAERNLLDGYLVKPVTASMLRDAVSEAAFDVPQFAPTERPDNAALAGLNILVVEDNRNNQQVARELLASRGARVDIAEDGLQGVERVMQDPSFYDLVLMDVQMPVMDGYTATRELRAARLTVPIVAMTANAMSGDREACLAAGMDDHVGKPFDLDDLVSTIRRLVHRIDDERATPSTPAPASPPAAAQGNAKADADADVGVQSDVDLAAAVKRLGGDAGFYKQLYPSVKADAEAMLERLAPLIAGGDREEARRLFHTIKGLAGTLGATALSRTASEAEQAMLAPEADAQQEAELLARTRRAYEAACARIDEELTRT